MAVRGQGGIAAQKRQFKMQGLSALQASLNKLPDQLQDRALKNASAAAARVIRDDAKARVPVDTGQLRDNIVVSRTFKQKGKRVKLRGKVVLGLRGAARYYGHLIEFGTSRQSPHPFMRPAMQAKAREALDVMAAKLKTEIEKQTKRLPIWRVKRALRDVKQARRMVHRRMR